jgi:phage terminase large subunit-like protein
MKDYAAIATQYARDVVDGAIPACRWLRLACQRHLNDLERDAAGWRYTWNPELTRAARLDADGNQLEGEKKYRPGDRACYFIELLPHIKGEWAARAERIRLEPSDVFFVASVFGWVDRNTGRRRFRIADLFEPRKNGKSTKAAAIGLYMFAADGEFGAEVYSGATSEDQAYEVFAPAKLMAKRTPELVQRFGITIRESNLSIAETNSKFEPVIGKPGDGASPSLAIIDEFHEHATEDLYDTMRTGMGARSQPLMLVITTAGDDISSPCFAHQEELQQILEGVIEDEQRFGLIYTIDVDDDGKLEDWTTEEALIKANPNYGVSVDPEFLLGMQRDAIRDPRKQATFQTKHLNLWVASASPWLPTNRWKAAADKTLKLESFLGQPCREGVDLANTTDIASRCKVFTRMIDARQHWYFFWRHYLPEAVIEEPENKHYQGWHKQGWIVATPGSMIDHGVIEGDIKADSKLYPLREAAFDPWGAPGIIGGLQNEFNPGGSDDPSLTQVLTVPLQARYLSAPMKFIDGLLRDGRLHHNGDPVAAWAVNNVTNKPDQNDNWFPRKPASKAKKTDPAVAMIIATARAMLHQVATGNIDEFLKDLVTA